MELMVLGLFCTLLLASLIFHFSILIAMMGGLILFLSYGAFRGFSLRELTAMTLQGVRKAGNILLTLLMIGVLTSVWRAAGTISTIVSCSADLLRPSVILLMSFLLNCLVSFLTGTSFGTGATMGVICGTIANAMGVPPVLSGGAILSGAFFGDRCSPVSTSMLLVSEITETDAYENIRTMFRTAFWPFVMTCLLYGALGLFCTGGGSVPDLKAVFSRELSLSPLTLIPAAVILILALFRVQVRKAMFFSILSALPLCVLLQGFDALALPGFMIFGFRSEDPQIAALLNGGGLLSMVRGVAIVCISSAYSGIFEATGLLTGIREHIAVLAKKTNGFAAVLLTSLVTAMASCNQTLSIMLTDQLCKNLMPDRKIFASWLEDTAVLTAPLIPWSIAGSTVLYSSGMPLSGTAAAFYLYLVPLWGLMLSIRAQKNMTQVRCS